MQQTLSSPTLPSARSTEFRDKLSRIRGDAAERQHADLRRRSDEDLLRAGQAVSAHAARDRVAAAITSLAHGFLDEAPAFELRRGIYDGRYTLVLRALEVSVDAEGNPARSYSRLQFLISLDIDAASLAVECRSTLHNRDEAPTLWVGTLDATDHDALHAFLEERFVNFARGYYAGPSARRQALLPRMG